MAENKGKVILDSALGDVVKDHIVHKFGEDGWSNFQSMIGTVRDKHEHTYFSRSRILSDRELSDIYTSDGIGKNIVDIIADDMTKKWISIENDTDNHLGNKLMELFSPKHFNLATKWRNLYGGSIIIMGIADGHKLEEAVVETSIKNIGYLRVYDRTEVQPSSTKVTDHESPFYGEPTYYVITPKDGSTYTVHRSRVLTFKGIPTTSVYSGETYDWWFWGINELQHTNDMLSRFGETIANVTQIVNELIVIVYKFKNLSSMIANNDEAKALFRARLNAIDQSKSTINAVVLDSEEDFDKITSTITGLADIIDRFMMLMSSVSRYPVSKLFGKSSAGLNATGEGDRDQYYDRVKAEQYNILQPPLQVLVNYLNMSLVTGKRVQDPKIIFNPLVQLTETQEIANRKVVAETDQIYMNAGVLDTTDVRENRFSNGYSSNTVVDVEE